MLQPVALHPEEEAVEPDLLLYWSADSPGTTIPTHARLLGTYAPGKTFALPSLNDRSGYLVLFSLPHQAVLESTLVEISS